MTTSTIYGYVLKNCQVNKLTSSHDNLFLDNSNDWILKCIFYNNLIEICFKNIYEGLCTMQVSINMPKIITWITINFIISLMIVRLIFIELVSSYGALFYFLLDMYSYYLKCADYV